MTASFFAVQPKDIEHFAPWFRPFLEKFENETCLVTADEIMAQLKRSDAQLWSYYDGNELRGVVVTRLHRSVAGLICNLWVCAGFDAVELVDGMLSEIESWARSIGCYAVEVVGRRGWEKYLSRIGFKRTAVVLEKRLAEVH